MLWNNRKKEKLNCPSPGGEILDRNLSSSRILQSASITFFFSFLTWQTIITGDDTRTQHLQNITILTLDLEFKWGSTKMCFFSLAILCRFWEMWERVLTRELPQGELHFSHCIFWCSCKKKRNYETKMTYFTASSSYQSLTTKHNEEHQDQKPTPSWWSSSFLENEVWREVARAPCEGFPNATDNDVLPNTLQSALQATQPIVQQAGLLNIFCRKKKNILWDLD